VWPGGVAVKRFLVGIVCILAFLFFVAGCAHTKPTEDPDIRGSFVEIWVTVSDPDCADCSPSVLSSGSGSAIAEDGDATIVLTAAHVCELEPELLLPAMMGLVELRGYTQGEDSVPVQVISMNREIDLCLLRIPLDLPILEIRPTQPDVNERVFNLAAPHGIYYEKLLVTFEGVYLGERIEGPPIPTRHYYRLTAGPGSSGSAILDADGRVVGVITHAPFRNGVWSPLALSPSSREVYVWVLEVLRKEGA
jgi:hypothetical protein